MTMTAIGSPIKRLRRHLHPLSAVFGASFVVALDAHPSPWRTAAVVVFVTTGLAITAIVIRRGGIQ